MDAEQIAPCPRCGAKAAAVPFDCTFRDGWIIEVDHDEDCYDRAGERFVYDTKREVIIAWNRRELRAAIDRAESRWKNATPEQKEAMMQAQRESWIRAFEPCEHGVVDFEQCPGCIEAAKARAILRGDA